MKRRWPLLLLACLPLAFWAWAWIRHDRLRDAPNRVPSPRETAPPDAATGPVPPRRLSRPDRLHAAARAHLAAGTAADRAEAEKIYREILDEIDPDDRVARRALGYVDFEEDVLGRRLEPNEGVIPESITHRRGHAFLDTVRELGRRRWLEAEVEIERAHAAVAAMREHERRLANDPAFRLGEQIRANVASDPAFGPYHYGTAWSPPFLVCYASGDRTSDHDLASLPTRVREVRKTHMRKAREVFEARAAEVALVLDRLHGVWDAQYTEVLDLRPLTDVHGGRPELPLTYRSYPDGVALVVWVFENAGDFQAHQYDWGGPHRGYFRQGSFSARTGWVMVHGLTTVSDPRAPDMRALTRSATHQLRHAFFRQANRWRMPRFTQSTLEDGLAAYVTALTLDVGPDSDPHLVGIDRVLLEDAQAYAAYRARTAKPYPLFPLRDLASFARYKDVWDWGETHWDFDYERVQVLFRQQAWMLVYFLQHYEEGRYRDRFHQLLRLAFTTEWQPETVRVLFARALEIDDDDEDEWAALEREFHVFVREDLLKR